MMTMTTKHTSTTRKSKAFLYVGGILIAAIWVGVFTALAVLQPTLKTKAIILAVGAGSTELILYAGAAWFGVSIFNKLRSTFRSHRD